jgi:radical SAM superfamily enzyme YgiQ (UPF0313 family)
MVRLPTAEKGEESVRVLLVSLPSLYEDQPLYPLGIGYLAGCLTGRHEVRALHFANMDGVKGALRAGTEEFCPQVVGLTCSTFNRSAVRKAIGWIRACRPDARVIVGGVHASYCYEQILAQYGADVAVIGEGEQTLPELCGALERGGRLDGVAGIAFRDGDAVRRTAPRAAIHDLDDLPLPDYSYAAETIRQMGLAFLITSRGCPAHCRFCSTSSFWGQRVRMYTPRRVVDEMAMVVERFGARRIFFHDDTFNLGFARVEAICKEIRDRRLDVEWGCSCRVFPVSSAMIATMVEGGCRHIGWGVESGSERILQTINKRITLAQIREAFELCRPYSDRLSTSAFLMVGNPGETEATIRETVEFLRTVPMTDPVGTSILYVLPGTELARSLQEQGHLRESDWVRYQTVPAYTIENSYLRMMRWSRRVNAGVQRLPFDPTRHLWRVEPLPDSKSSAGSRGVFAWARRAGRRAMRLAVGARKLLPAGRLRF